jgi:hypothetical protein
MVVPEDGVGGTTRLSSLEHAANRTANSSIRNTLFLFIALQFLIIRGQKYE